MIWRIRKSVGYVVISFRFNWLAQVAPVGPIRRYRVIRNQPDPPPDDLKDKIMENEEIKKELERRREGK